MNSYYSTDHSHRKVQYYDLKFKIISSMISLKESLEVIFLHVNSLISSFILHKSSFLEFPLDIIINIITPKKKPMLAERGNYS